MNSEVSTLRASPRMLPVLGALALIMVTCSSITAQSNRRPADPGEPASFSNAPAVATLLAYVSENLVRDSVELVIVDHRAYGASYRSYLRELAQTSGFRIWDVGPTRDACTSAVFCPHPESLMPFYLGGVTERGDTVEIRFGMDHSHPMMGTVQGPVGNRIVCIRQLEGGVLERCGSPRGAGGEGGVGP